MPVSVFGEDVWTTTAPFVRESSSSLDSQSITQGQIALFHDVRESDPMVFDPDGIRPLPFSAASHKWLQTRKKFLKESTFYLYSVNLNHLNLVFGEVAVQDIRLHYFTTYQEMRTVNACCHGFPNGEDCPEACGVGLWAQEAGPSVINHELNMVQQTLRRAGLWHCFRDYYQPLRVPKWKPPKTMDDEQERHLFRIAVQNDKWSLAYLTALVSCNTSATGTELRHIRLRHLVLDDPRPHVFITGDHLKNDARDRRIELNRTAVDAFRALLKRARELGSTEPDHFLFPFRLCRGKFEPTRAASASFIRSGFESLRRAAGMPWLTPHCFRHQCITVMYEHEADDQTVMHTVGHISAKMSHWYSHNRRKKQRSILDAIDTSVRFGPKSVTIPQRFSAYA